MIELIITSVIVTVTVVWSGVILMQVGDDLEKKRKAMNKPTDNQFRA